MKYGINALKTYAVNRPAEPLVVRQRYYDHLLYPTAGQTELKFFQVPQGQGLSSSTGAAALTKRLTDTNMTLSGQLPAPKALLVETIEVIFFPGSVSTANTFTSIAPAAAAATYTTAISGSVNDVYAVLSTGALQFNIGSTSWLNESGLYSFPPAAYIGMDAAFALTTASLVGGPSLARAEGLVYRVDPELVIMTSQNFDITVSWPVAVATPSGFNGRIGVFLGGVEFRLSQ